MLKLVRTKFKSNKKQIDFVNENKAIINKRLYDIPQRLEHNSYLNRSNIEDANKIARTITKNSQIHTPFTINTKSSQLENQKYQQEDLAQHIPEPPSLTLLKRNRRSDSSSDEDRQALKDSKLFDVVRQKLSEEKIIEEIQNCLNDGARINAKNIRKKTVLHIAIEKGYKDVIIFLLEQKGIKTDIPNKDKKIALDLAKHLNKQDIVNILENYNQQLTESTQQLSQPKGDGDGNTSAKSSQSNVRPSTGSSSEAKDKSIIDSSGQQATSSKRKSTDNDQDSTGKRMKVDDVRKRPHDNEDSVSPEKKPNISLDKSNVVAMPGKDGTTAQKNSYSKNPHFNNNDVVSTSRKELLDNLEIPSEGSKLAQHGNIFQLKLLMLFLWRAKENGYSAFRLATELSEAEKFDDVAFQYQQNNGETWKFRLLQAKHKEGDTVEAKLPKIKKVDLLSTDDNEAFSLQKYFRSYLKIKQRSKESSIYSVFSQSEIEDISVITNTDFDSERLKNDFFQEEKDQEKNIAADQLLKVNKDQNAKIYKLKDPENNENELIRELKLIFANTSDFYKLIEELADHILTGKQIDKTGLFKDYYYPLISEVFNIEKEEEKNELPSDTSELEELVKKLANYAKQKKELTVSDFKDYHVALAKKIINPNTKKFFTNIKKDTKEWKFIESFKKEMATIRKVKVTTNELKLIEFNLSSGFGKFKYYPLSKFISENNLSEEAEKFRDALIKEIAFIQKNNQKLEISKEFGKNELPSADSDLEELAKKLADSINNDKELTISDFKDYHIALATEVINLKTKKFSSNFITTKNKLRDFLEKEIPNLKNKKSKPIEFKISEEFGKNELPSNNYDLEELAKKLADSINNDKELTISDFKDYHIALATEVIDVNTKKFQEIFIHGKIKESNNIKQLSTLSKQFRRILLDKIVNDGQVKSAKDSLKTKEIKLSEGFEKAFTPESNSITEVEEFVKQIKELLSNTISLL